jgi:hypothetical protein
VIFQGSTVDIPALLKPPVEILFVDHAFPPLLVSGLSISTGLALHQDKFYVILDNRIWFVWFPEELGPIEYLVGCIGYPVPDDRIEVIETNPATDHANVRMEGKDQMPAKPAPCDTDIPNDTDQSFPRNENPEHMEPHFSEFPDKGFVILDVSRLVWILVIPFEIPVGGATQLRNAPKESHKSGCMSHKAFREHLNREAVCRYPIGAGFTIGAIRCDEGRGCVMSFQNQFSAKYLVPSRKALKGIAPVRIYQDLGL